MWEELEERVLCCAEYIVQTGCTVRACSAHFSISKSTVHKDMTERLPYVDKVLYEEVRDVLDKNLRERHIRGGNATKRKYESQRVKKEEKLGRLKEYEKMYEQGKIPLKALEKQREKCRILEAQEGAE